MILRKVAFLFGIVFCSPFILLSQNYSEAYSAFDSIVGVEALSLIEGTEYIEDKIVLDDRHQFFQTDRFQTGNLHYNDQHFTGIQLRYDIAQDFLIARIKKTLGEATFKLIPAQVQDFEIGNSQFTYLNSQNIKAGFYQVLAENGNSRLLKKHLRTPKAIRDRDYVHYRFIEEDPIYYLDLEGELVELGSRRSSIRNLPEFRESLNDYYRNNSRLYKRETDRFMRGLFREIAQ